MYVHIFSHCQPDMVGGFGSFLWRNIAATEVLAACQLMLVEQCKWPDVLENVIYLGGAVANCLNAKVKR